LIDYFRIDLCAKELPIKLEAFINFVEKHKALGDETLSEIAGILIG
jgi:hypothetical protein